MRTTARCVCGCGAEANQDSKGRTNLLMRNKNHAVGMLLEPEDLARLLGRSPGERARQELDEALEELRAAVVQGLRLVEILDWMARTIRGWQR